MPEQWTLSLGASAERLAELHNVSREAQDVFALRSHPLAAKAYDDGIMGEVVAVPGVELARDEGVFSYRQLTRGTRRAGAGLSSREAR